MKQRNINFKQSTRERRADTAYGNFKKALAHHIDKFVFKKYGKN
jgi:hypothetical protein